MAIQNFFTSRENSADASTFVGQEGRLWYNIDDNIIYASDGTTPGGIPVTSGSPSVYGDANVVVLLSNNFGSNTIVTTGNITAGNLLTDSIVSSAGNILIDGNLIPAANSYTLGSVTDPWESAFFGPQSVTIQDSTGNADLSVVIENTAGNITIDTAGFEIRTLATEIPIFRIEALTGQIFSNALTIIENDTNASNTTSGSLQTAGGAGIAKDMYVGGNVAILGDVSNVGAINFDTSYTESGSEPTGSMHWSSADDTLELHHPNGVVQQMGQELYGYVRNNTGNTIPNGTAVQFAGAEMNGTARLEVAPMIADGSSPTLYVFGITTESLADGADGRVTVWGKVRDLDTTGNGAESWSVGDLLYVSASTAGELTNVRPTAPNNVIPIAAVLRVDASEGELFVRPTIEQQKNYGKFSRTTDQAVGNANTAITTVFNSSSDRQNINLDGSDASKIVFSEAGLYSITVNAQLLSTNSSAKDTRIWLAKDGTNLSGSTRVLSLASNNEYKNLTLTHNVSMTANSYIQVKFASTDTTVGLKAAPSTAYAPASNSIDVIIIQPAL